MTIEKTRSGRFSVWVMHEGNLFHVGVFDSLVRAEKARLDFLEYCK